MAPARPPRSNRSIRLTPRGKAFGVLSIVLAVFAYAGGNRVLLAAACLLFALTLMAVLLARFRSLNLSLERSFAPSPVAASSTTTVTIDTANLASMSSAPLYWNDTLPWRPLATIPAHLGSLAGPSGSRSRRHARLSYELSPPRRGVFGIGPFAVAYSDPFGLAVGFMTVGKTSELIVTPHVAELPSSGVWLEAPDGTARLVQATGIGNSDDLMTREYRRGDALRRVHWRASARHGQLMVRQEEQRVYPEATIVVDTREAGYTDYWGTAHLTQSWGENSDGFEWAVSMLASVGVHLHRAGFVVHVVETSETQIAGLADAEARAGREEDFLLSLARIRLQKASGRPSAALADGPVFAIISTPDADTLEWLLALRRPFELGVVFLVGASRRVASELSLAGWRVIPVDTYVDPVVAWRVLAEELGATSVNR